MTQHSCWACPKPYTTWRLPSNPPWGTNPQGARIEELAFLRGKRPANAVPSCDEHKTWRYVDGRALPAYEPKTEGAKLNWRQRGQQRIQDLRASLIALLGGVCKECGVSEPDMCLSLLGDASGIFAALGKHDNQSRLQWMLAHPDRVLLTCVDHLPHHPRVNPSTLGHRARVESAYGGQCAVCGTTENLGIVAGPDAPRLQWPGGRRYSSRDKLAYLVRNDFPPQWSLRCRRHPS